MSKIFEALQGARSEVSDLLPSLVGDDPGFQPAPDSGGRATGQAAAPPPAEPIGEIRSGRVEGFAENEAAPFPLPFRRCLSRKPAS